MEVAYINPAFLAAETIGRDKTYKILPKYNLIESEDPYSVWDFSGVTHSIADDNKEFFIEVKNRDTKSTAFQNQTVFLEYSKFISLMDISKNNNNAKIFYVSHFKDISFIHNLSKIKLADIRFNIVKAPKTTAGANDMIDKWFIELPYSSGKIYKIKN